MADIVERLKARAEQEYEMLGDIHLPLLEAADEIERLRVGMSTMAEAMSIQVRTIERLRATLEKIECYEDREWITRSGEAPTEVQYLCSIARAALQQEVK